MPFAVGAIVGAVAMLLAVVYRQQLCCTAQHEEPDYEELLNAMLGALAGGLVSPSMWLAALILTTCGVRCFTGDSFLGVFDSIKLVYEWVQVQVASSTHPRFL